MRPQELYLLPVFAAVARHASFTKAARELRLTKSVVSRHVRTLEELCGARLIDRTTRRLRVTQIGLQVLAAATDVVKASTDVDQITAAHGRVLKGTIRVTAPFGLSALLVAPVAAELGQLHPDISIEIDSDDRPRDLIGEGFDLALRMSPLRDSTQIVRRLGWDDEIIVCAPEALKPNEGPAHPGMLRGAPWVLHSSVNLGNELSFRSSEGDQEHVSVRPRAIVSTAASVAALAGAGLGFALLPRHFVAADLAAGRLAQACVGWGSRRLSLHALLPGRKNPPLVTLFLNRIHAAVGKMGFQMNGV